MVTSILKKSNCLIIIFAIFNAFSLLFNKSYDDESLKIVKVTETIMIVCMLGIEKSIISEKKT